MCNKEAHTWNNNVLGCVSDIVVHSLSSKDQQCRFSASAYNATDIYKRLCIIYFCDERDTTQVASITLAQDGIRLVNLSASGGDEALPTSVFLSRSMFVLYNVYPPEGSQEVQILVNFSTLMDFLECALANVTHEELVHPLHIVLDNWLYVSLQRTPTIGELDKAMSTSLATAIQRFCLIPTDCLGGTVEDTQTVPRGDDQLISESDELMDNTILMLHPLNPKLLDPSCLLPFSSAQGTLPRVSKQSAKAVPTTRGQITPKSPADVTTPKSTPDLDKSESEQTPRKRLKTTSDQIQMLEEWFQKEPLPPRKLREEMVSKLDGSVSLRQLEVWFQNRRAKQKKAETRRLKMNGGVGEVPSTPPFSPLASPLPSPPSTPSTPSTPISSSSSFSSSSSSSSLASLHGMAPNPSTLIPSSPSPTVTPSRKKARINSQGNAVNSSPALSISTPSSSSSSSSSPSLASISPLATPTPISPPSNRAIAKISKSRSVSPAPQVPSNS